MRTRYNSLEKDNQPCAAHKLVCGWLSIKGAHAVRPYRICARRDFIVGREPEVLSVMKTGIGCVIVPDLHG